MALQARVLSIGHDPTLMSLRSILLRRGGYLVEELYSTAAALRFLESNPVDLVLLCQTIPRDERNLLIGWLRAQHLSMPVLYIKAHEFIQAPKGCIGVLNFPNSILQAVNTATLTGRSLQAGSKPASLS